MDKSTIVARIDELNKASNAYYNTGNPIMSDAEFDNKLEELKRWEIETGISLANSPTRNVGFKVLNGIKEVTHATPMLSLDKCHNVDEIIEFSQGHSLVGSVKLDGCFEANQKVLMADFTRKKISEIKVGDYVKSYNETTGKIENSKVVNVFCNGKKEYKEWNRIFLDCSNANYFDIKKGRTHKQIICTKNHKFYTKNGWIESKDLLNEEVANFSYIMSKTQKSVLLGILLGDGHFVSSKRNKVLKCYYINTLENETKVMLDYIDTLYSFNNPIHIKRVSGYHRNIGVLELRSMKVPEEFLKKENQLRCGLTFTQEICNMLTPLSLALFYIDDGSKAPSQEDGYDTANKKVRCQLAVNRHNIEEIKTFSQWLNDHGYYNHYSLEKEVKTQNGGSGFHIIMTTEGTEKFFDDICKYIPYELRKRKLGLRDKWQNSPLIQWWNDQGEYNINFSPIEQIKEGHSNKYNNRGLKYRRTYRIAYDLEVENNHNYFVDQCLVHNCTVRLTYKDGSLVLGESRGNGVVGSDVTEHVKQFYNVPLHINKEGTYVIDGEALIKLDDFAEINKNGEYKNSRNLASGTLSTLDTSVVKKRRLSWYAWEVVENKNGASTFFSNLCEAMALGFDVVPFDYVMVDDFYKLQEYIDSFIRIADEKHLPQDGVVFKFDDVAYGKSLGNTSHHYRNGIAYKIFNDSVETELLDIEWTMGKTGSLCPTAIFKPVEIEGTIVERASLHNISVMKNIMGGAWKGQHVGIYKANLIIPQVRWAEQVRPDNAEMIDIPSVCPICGSPTKIVKDNDSEVLYCTNDDCKGRLLGKLSHAVSKSALNVDGLSESTIQRFINLGWLNSIQDIYHLSDHEYEMRNLDGFGEKSVKKLLNSIEKSRNTNLARFIYSLSIPLCGKTASKAIAENVDWGIRDFITIMGTKKAIYFSSLDGIGDKIISSLDSYWHKHSSMVYELSKEFVFEKPIPIVLDKTPNTLNGKIFVVTGSVHHYSNRDSLKQDIVSHGGTVASSVSSKTSYLINNDINSTSSKNQKAKSLNIPIITEEEFIWKVRTLATSVVR